MKTIIITPEIEEAVSHLHSDEEIAALFRTLIDRTPRCRKVGAPYGNRNAAKNNSKQFKTIEEKETEKAIEKATEKEKYQKNKEKDNEKVKEKEERGKTDNTAPRFVPPKLEEIKDFILERNYQIDPEVFFYYYEANGWHVGRAPMKNWRAAVAQWNAREKNQDREYADNQRTTPTGKRLHRRPTIAELTVESAAQAIANLQQRRESPLAEVFGW